MKSGRRARRRPGKLLQPGKDLGGLQKNSQETKVGRGIRGNPCMTSSTLPILFANLA